MRLKQRQVLSEMTIMEYADSHLLHLVEWYLGDKRTLFVWFVRVYCGYTVSNASAVSVLIFIRNNIEIKPFLNPYC